MQQAPILVIGASGKTGWRIAQRLTLGGRAVRRGSRHSGTIFDWNDQGTWDAALAGAQAAYISYAPDLAIPGAVDAIGELVERAEALDVRRLVLLSGRGEEEAQKCERLLQRSNIDWTIVRASWFSQNFSEGAFLEMVLQGKIELPAGAVAEPFVDADDIADVAVAALTEDGHAGQIYEVTGPRLLTFRDVAQEISRGLGRSIQFVPVSAQEFEAGLRHAHLPQDIAWLLNYLFSTVLDGRNEQVCDGVRRALGREPRDFSRYVRQCCAEGIWSPRRSEVG